MGNVMLSVCASGRSRRWKQGEIINDAPYPGWRGPPAGSPGAVSSRLAVAVRAAAPINQVCRAPMTSARYFALIPAAGVGARMGASCPKQYLPVAGKPMLLHALAAFAASDLIAHVFLVVSPEDGYVREVLDQAPQLAGRVTVLYEGGATRHASVLNGLRAVRERLADDDWVLVHDAARPGLTGHLIGKLVQALRDDEVGGLLAMPVVDTLKRAGGDQRALETVARDGLWAAQTPQMFRYALLQKALQACAAVTDEASAIEALGLQPKLVEGSPRNFKVTLPQDVALAELYLKALP